MTLELLNRVQLQIINRKGFRYPLDVAEKDYFLALVSKILYESTLKDKLVFKGGTALHHTYLPQMRFSEDLDFTATSPVTLENLTGVFAAHDFLELKEHHVSPYTIKINRLNYTGPLGMPNSLKLKVEVDVAQKVILPACDKEYCWNRECNSVAGSTPTFSTLRWMSMASARRSTSLSVNLSPSMVPDGRGSGKR